MSRIGLSGFHQGVRSGTRPAGRPFCSDYSLDAGIRLTSNTCSGSASEVAEGEVNAHLRNPRYDDEKKIRDPEPGVAELKGKLIEAERQYESLIYRYINEDKACRKVPRHEYYKAPCPGPSRGHQPSSDSENVDAQLKHHGSIDSPVISWYVAPRLSIAYGDAWRWAEIRCYDHAFDEESARFG